MSCYSIKNKTLMVIVLFCFVTTLLAFGDESDDRQRVVAPGAELVIVIEGFRYTEGPAWSRNGKLYFTVKSSSRSRIYDR